MRLRLAPVPDLLPGVFCAQREDSPVAKQPIDGVDRRKCSRRREGKGRASPLKPGSAGAPPPLHRSQAGHRAELRRTHVWQFLSLIATFLVGCTTASGAACGEGVYFGDLVSVYSDMPAGALGSLTLYIGATEQSAILVEMEEGVLPGAMQLDVDLDCSIPDLWASEVYSADCRASTLAEYSFETGDWTGNFGGQCYSKSLPDGDNTSAFFDFTFTAHRVGPSLRAAER